MNPEEKIKYQSRVLIFYVAIILMMSVLLGGLAYRQLFTSAEFKEAGKIQNHRRILTPGPRGNIYDRQGRVLVSNQAKFSAVIFLKDKTVREEFEKKRRILFRDFQNENDILTSRDRDRLTIQARAQVIQTYLNDVNRVLGREESVDAKTLSRHFYIDPLLPYPIIDDLNREEFAILLESLPIQSPVQVYASSSRFYPYEAAAAHTLGFVSNAMLEDEVDLPGEDLKTFASKGTFGRDGVEKQYDEYLQGKTGTEIWLVDPSGFQVKREQRVHPEKGKDVYLSLDIDLQLAAEEKYRELEIEKGALIALDVETLEVLAMVSLPAYNLNDTTPRFKSEVVKWINENEAWPNRAFQGIYPPGSPYKLVTTIAGLQHGVITKDTEYECSGYHKVGDRLFPCHNRNGHGDVNVKNAIRVSCNVFYYNVGLEIGVDRLSATAMHLGLHKESGIDLPNETSRMLVPTKAWKKENRGYGWTPGDTANMSIGQGFNISTPIQLALLTASIARNEVVSNPSILKLTPDQVAERPRGPDLGLNDEQYNILIDGMKRAVAIGTGKNSQVEGVAIAGKTGTAQFRKRVDGKTGTLEMAWFVAFGPVENPKVAIAVLSEGTVIDKPYGGSIYAAPIAQAVLQTYFDKHPELVDD
ncbi:MAG: penicillin-binding protein 2 [Verrucomicrobiota bacterium]